MTASLIQTVVDSTFEPLVLEGRGPIAVEFMSYGCAHCRKIEPVMQRVAEMLGSKEHIFRVNVAVEQGLADTYNIQATPTLVMFSNAREVGRVEGPQPNVESVMAALTGPFDA